VVVDGAGVGSMPSIMSRGLEGMPESASDIGSSSPHSYVTVRDLGMSLQESEGKLTRTEQVGDERHVAKISDETSRWHALFIAGA